MIFEVEAGGPGGLQLCGGGRYDELLGALQGPGPRRSSSPAVGFAYGLERVASVSTLPLARQKPSVMVAASDKAYARAMQTADALRTHGFRVLLDVRSRSLQANLRDAERRGCQALVVVEDVAEDGLMAWHDVGTEGHAGSSRTGTLAGLIESAKRRTSIS
jgi:histidyl-tRNA synthetase